MHKFLVVLGFLPFICRTQVNIEHARAVTKTLCSPEFQGRGYVNGGDSIAAEFVAAELTKAGCRPFKKHSVFQDFSFVVNTFPGQMNLVLNGRTLVPGVDYEVDPASGGGTADIQLMPLQTHEILDPKIMDRKRTLFKSTKGLGAMIFTVGAKGDTLKQLMRVVEELTAYVPVVEISDTKFTWSVAQEQHKFPLIKVQPAVLEFMDVKNQVIDGTYRMNYSITAKLINHNARNVIAYVPAVKKSKKKKYLVFTAHYDHLGRMGQQTYFPGGNDNASGTAMLIELASYFAKNPIDLNVVFIAFAGEEAGLLGSQYYVQHPVFPLEKIHFLTNVDIMGSGEDGVTIVNATLFPQQFETLQAINNEKKYLVKIGSRGAAANSDHYFFSQAGVPAFFMYTMGPNKHYHDIYDTYEELSFNEFGDIYQLLIDFGKTLPR